MKFSISVLLTSILPPLAFAQNASTNFLGSTPSQRFVIDQTQAQTVIQAAAAQAKNAYSPSSIAVVDPSGFLVAFLKTDNAFGGGVDIAIKKARTVALFNGAVTTAALLNLTSPPDSQLFGLEDTNGGLIVVGGGLPLFAGGHFVGAIGVSAGLNAKDVVVATAGAAALGGA